MVKFVTQVSSIYPIDLTSVLYRGSLHPDSQFEVYVSDALELPSHSINRQYVARASLPTLNWDQDDKGNWRQIHIPIEKCYDVSSVKKALHLVWKSILNP